MFFPAYKVNSSKSLNEVAQSIGVNIDTLQSSFTCIIARSEHLKDEKVKYIKKMIFILLYTI
ncbi:hypothetical protein ZW20_11790 [Salmonella enterica subsp. enterica]|nr:hypothetical protein [Salmonella enterica subsp. enterica]